MYRLSVLKCPLTAYGLNTHPKIKKSVWQFCIAPAMNKLDDNFEICANYPENFSRGGSEG